jgi:ligand-binding sensor domain-containing protein/serine phosphatase RsbU (regulator of sigma subunit)
MPYYRFYIVIVILQLIRPLYGQSYLQPEVFPVENGLSSQYVTCLAMDHNGYLWVGTQSGLNRYDGYRFVQIFSGRNGLNASNNLQISAIRTDRRGNLWILSEEGISKYEHKSGNIRSYSLALLDSIAPGDKTARDIIAGNDGEIWILTNTMLISLESGGKKHYYTIPHNRNQGDSVTYCLEADGQGNLWLGTSGGILYFDRQQRSFQQFMAKNTQGLLTDHQVNCLFLDKENILWIGTRNGLNRFDPVDFDFDGYFAGKGNHQPSNDIHCIDQTPDGRLIVSTSSGLFSFNKEKGTFTGIQESVDFKITSLAVDTFGTIWGGTSRGILKIRKSRLSVGNFTSHGTGIILSDDRINSVAPGPAESIFIGYANNTFDIADFAGMARRNYPTLDGSRVINFYPFREGEFIILSEHGLEVYRPGTDKRTSLSDRYPFVRKNLLNESSLYCMKEDGMGSLWLGTSAGLQHIRFDSARHRVISALRHDGQSLDIGKVYDIETDADHNLWLGTENGLVLYDPGHGSFYKYTPYDKTLLDTEHKEVYTVMAESSRFFWIGTSRGAYRFDVSTREFTAVLSDPDFLATSVRAIAIDHSQKVWMGSGRGLYCINNNSGTPLYFDQREGLVNYGYTAICSGKNGSLYLGGRDGLSVIDPDHVGPVEVAAGVVITRLHLIEKEPKNEQVFYLVPDTLVLPWARKPVQIDFASMNLARPEFSKFKYSIERTGKKPVWHSLGKQNYVILDHLSPGKYAFRVSETGPEVTEETKGALLVLIIEAPMWRSGIAVVFYIIAGLLIIILALSGLMRRFFNLSRENQEREMFARQIILQKEELTLKNKSITDSINYARRIQTAMLPPYRLFKTVFPSSFVLYMPKDIVSGDFYWINKLNDKIFVAAVDCTGHGVPGAFMSIIGFELFRKITNIEGLSRPSDILNRLNEDFHVIFKDVDNVVLRDGMDVAFCSIDKKNLILEFAGAFNPLYLIRDNKITEIKGDRFAIGLDETNFKEQTFKNHLIPIQMGDIIYIFSDGFADQFGGPDGKKYKYRRFRHLLLNLHQLPMQKQHEILENNVMEWRGEQEQVDDILVIGIKIDF